MKTSQIANRLLGLLPARGVARVARSIQGLPVVRQAIDRQYEDLVAELGPSLKPYQGAAPTFTAIPPQGLDEQTILGGMAELRAKEESRWKDGFASGAVYSGDPAHTTFLDQVYALNSQSNPLHADLWPSTTKYEAEVVAMTARLLGAETLASGNADGVCGTVSSGGTESILLAVKTYRDWARETRGITRPQVVAPVSAHAAFDKAAQYFHIELVRTPVDRDGKADVAAVERAIGANTIALVGSAPSFPHGVMDPIEAISGLALSRGIPFHTDACLGGFLLPWAERLGYPVPPFDFRLPGVTSISADTHKYGYAAKGSSVILYRGRELRHFQYYTTTDWPGGLYLSPTFAGSRPGALSACCWAAMVRMGESGYLDAASRILQTAKWLRDQVSQIPGLALIGDSLFVIAFTSPTLNVYAILDFLANHHWSLNGLHSPPAAHLCVTLRHCQPGVAQRFVDDLRAAAEHVAAHPSEHGSLGPVYGLATSVPTKGLVQGFLKRYIDLLYEA